MATATTGLRATGDGGAGTRCQRRWIEGGHEGPPDSRDGDGSCPKPPDAARAGQQTMADRTCGTYATDDRERVAR